MIVRGIEMKASSFIKKSLIIGLTVSLLGMSAFAQSADDDEVELLDGETAVVVIEETEVVPELSTTTGTIVVKGKSGKEKVSITRSGKKQFSLEPATDSILTVKDLASFNGKIVIVTGTPEKKTFKVSTIDLLAPSSAVSDAK